MRISFFISNHGFGHVMRQLPVAAELLDRGHEVVIVTGEKQGRIAAEYLRERAEVIVAHTDAGLVVKPGTIILDTEKTAERIREHIGRWPEFISFAPDADIYVVDICPWALLAAKERGVPSLLMASFTWVEQYEPFLETELLEKYKTAFRSVDHVLYYDLVNKPTRELLGDGIDVGFVARPVHDDKVLEIRSQHEKPLVYLSLGGSNSGLAEAIDVSSLPYDFITTSALNLKGDNVEQLGVDIDNTQDYVAAADYCIAKAGWSTVSEMMIAGVKFAVLNRPDVPEDTMIIEELERRGAGIGIDTTELQNIDSVIERLKDYNWNEKSYTNNHKHIASIIEEKH